MEHKTCKHEKANIEEEKSFCKKCGCFLYNEVEYLIIFIFGQIIGFKPKHYMYRPEHCNIELFNQMKLESNNYRPKQLSKKYSGFRVELLAFIKGISKKLRLQTRTYYLACLLVDRIFLSSLNTDFKPAITAVSCVLLAGIIFYLFNTAKFHEVDISLRQLNEFEIKGKKYSFQDDQIKKYEVLSVKAIDYSILTNSAYDIIKFFLALGCVLSNDFVITSQNKTNGEKLNADVILNEDEDKNNSIDYIEVESPNESKLKSVVAKGFYTEVIVEKIYALSYSILYVFIEGKGVILKF